MKRTILRVVVFVILVTVLFGGTGFIGFIKEQQDYWTGVPSQPAPAFTDLHIPAHDPAKPTVAVVLGDPTTEVFDFVVPYEMFVMTGAYNVYAVAPTKERTTLSGGLDLLPHYTYAELDALLGKSPDLLVVPNMTMPDQAKYQPVREWLQKHAETQILSICGGAGNLADAGLLNGKTATIHWQAFSGVQRTYPEVNWVRGLRYVEDGNIVGSAGLTSGIDAVLYVIARDLGEPAAEKIAQAMNYPSYHFVNNPKVDPYYVDRTEMVYLLNIAFQWNETDTGVMLYEGMDDGALASIFDTYSASGTTQVYTIAPEIKPVVTKYHLNLVPRYTLETAPELDRLFVSGAEAEELATTEVGLWAEAGKTTEPEYLHADSADRFIFDAPLEDLAKQEDVLTAKYGAKRLEYRADDLQYKGLPFSLESFGNALLTLLLAILVAVYVDRRFLAKKK